MKLIAKLFGVFAVGAFVAGVLLGFLPVTEGCGSPFSGKSLGGDACDVIRSDQRQIPVALLVLGVTFAAAAVIASGRTSVGSAPHSAPDVP